MVCISDLTLEEIKRCQQPKQTTLLSYLEEIEHEILHGNDEVDNLAKEYIENEVLNKLSPKKISYRQKKARRAW